MKTIQCAHLPHHHWLFGDMPAMDGQWWSSRMVSVRTNRVYIYIVHMKLRNKTKIYNFNIRKIFLRKILQNKERN